jgi:ketosteroid isomerase-like protein
MTRPLLALVILFSSLNAPSQQSQSPATCPATEQTVREVEHKLWSAARSRDADALDQLIDDSFISTDDGGVRKGKQEVLREMKKPEGNIHNETDEEPADIRLVFTNGVAILNFSKHWTDYDKKAGISFGGTSVMTRVFTCKGGEWKLVSFHETGIPNRTRQPSASAIAHLDDYVGHYLLDEGSVKGEITVARRGDKLLETWPGEEPIEILPGKYDTFFTRHDGWVERFVRDKSGKVTGILYTQTDGEVEARRMP